MSTTTNHFYGKVLFMRPPVPVTCNKAGANYKSEVAHTTYYPRRAFAEWLHICDAIVDSGGDAIFAFEDQEDAPFLDHEYLRVDEDGNIYAQDSADCLENMSHILTGRVFTANGPWVICCDGNMQVLLPNMLAHRKPELPYYTEILQSLADQAKVSISMEPNPHRWEGLADVTPVGPTIVFTYTQSGHYDEGISTKLPDLAARVSRTPPTLPIFPQTTEFLSN